MDLLIDNKIDKKDKVKLIVLDFLEKSEIPYTIINNENGEKICIELTYKQQMSKNLYYYTPLIVLTSNKDVCKVYPYEIMYIAIEDRESVLHLINERIIKTNYNISYWEGVLPAECFERPHNSYIVNLNYVTEVTREFVYLKYKEKSYSVYTSQRKVAAFKKAFLNFRK